MTNRNLFRRNTDVIVVMISVAAGVLLVLCLLFALMNGGKNHQDSKEASFSGTQLMEDTAGESFGVEDIIDSGMSFEEDENLEETPIPTHPSQNNPPKSSNVNQPTTKPSHPQTEESGSQLPPKAPRQEGEWGVPVQN